MMDPRVKPAGDGERTVAQLIPRCRNHMDAN